MNDPTVSVIVVSRGRPDALKRCLTGLSQLQFKSFEIVVVSDPAGMQAAEALAFASHLKLVGFDEANISAARNLGLENAAGEIVAFIDDDAVPEPQWLRHLTAAATRDDIAAMGGFVRGRNGISFQWRARTLDAWGEAHDLDVHQRQPTVLTPPKGQAIKTEGTNMAFRRDVLLHLGGFDPAFHYFLDETDVNMRLARAGYATAIVPLAEVHHGFAANTLRDARRVPRDLFDIGASWAVFHRKHRPDTDHRPQWTRLRASERRRLMRHMISGALEPRDVRRLMRRLDEGHLEGQSRPFGRVHLASHPKSPFLAFPSVPRESVLIPVRRLHESSARKEAAERVKDSQIVTVLCLSPTAVFHHLWFDDEGYWMQKGGLFGKSERTDPLFKLTTWAKRVQRERERIVHQSR